MLKNALTRTALGPAGSALASATAPCLPRSRPKTVETRALCPTMGTGPGAR